MRVFENGDKTGLYLSWLEQWAFIQVSRLWRAIVKPRMGLNATKPIFAMPQPLRPEHVAGCTIFADREAMIESFEKGLVWAEVGTFRGTFAKKIHEVCLPSELHLIDMDFSLVRETGQVAECEVVRFHQGDSAARLKDFPDAYFDCIYVDAGHDLCAVARDVDAAAPKLKPGGLLIFNDYIVYSYLDQIPFGIVHVVNALCNEDGWKMVAFALNFTMYCDVALRKV